MNEASTITVTEPISSLWNVVDNRVVSWLNRKVDWIFWWGATAAQVTGYVTGNQGLVLNLTQKAISTALHTFGNYANVHRIQSTFHVDEINDLTNKANATSAEKYQLANLLYQRALQYDFEAEILLASPGHFKEEADFLIRFSRFYVKSELCSYLVLRGMFGEELWVRPPEIAIIHDIKAARALYKEVMDSDDPLLTEALKADAIYKYAFLFVHGSFCENEPGDILTVVNECKLSSDVFTDKGNYETQMDRLSRVVDLSTLVHLSRHHPRQALESMEEFGITINRYRDICKTCSKNMGIKEKFTYFWA